MIRRNTGLQTRPGPGAFVPNAHGAKPAKKMRVPAYTRTVRFVYALLASVFVACVLVQVFFAGMGAFGADWSRHINFVHIFTPLPLLMTPVAFVGRLPWELRLLPLGLLVLIGAQYAFASTAVPAAALHPVNALLIFWMSLRVARRAWASVAGQRKG